MLQPSTQTQTTEQKKSDDVAHPLTLLSHLEGLRTDEGKVCIVSTTQPGWDDYSRVAVLKYEAREVGCWYSVQRLNEEGVLYGSTKMILPSELYYTGEVKFRTKDPIDFDDDIPFSHAPDSGR